MTTTTKEHLERASVTNKVSCRILSGDDKGLFYPYGPNALKTGTVYPFQSVSQSTKAKGRAGSKSAYGERNKSVLL